MNSLNPAILQSQSLDIRGRQIPALDGFEELHRIFAESIFLEGLQPQLLVDAMFEVDNQDAVEKAVVGWREERGEWSRRRRRWGGRGEVGGDGDGGMVS